MTAVWRHASCVAMRTWCRLTRPTRSIEAHAARLHEIEQLGWDAATPMIALTGVVFFLLPVFLFLVSAAFGAYYLSGG